ncbi:MAG: helix-turn-helix domain-containing protein [Actinobacteria bacterium]|nr:helix-turn-helix domain-containing protein [Actinomycetota bacterium]
MDRLPNRAGAQRGDKETKWKSEPVYEFSGLLSGGPDPRGERVYSVTEAVKETGLSEKLIRQEIEAGNIPVVDLPGKRRTWIRRQDLNSYIQLRVTRADVDD